MYGINNAKLKLLVGAFVSLIGLYAKLANTLQVTLLDTTNLDTLGWVTHSTGDEDIGRRGWREASYNNRGDVFRVYTVCNVAAVTVDNWLRLPYIVVPSDHDVKHTLQTTTTSSSSRTGDTENLQIRLYVEMKFTMRRCTKYPDLDRLQSCRESFKLLARATTSEDEEDVLTRGQSDWRPDGYRMVGAVAADRVFDESADAATAVNVETRGFTVSGGSGVYFALRDEGACATLLGIRIYYIVCEAVVTDFTIFPTSVTSPELTSVVQIHGSCVENAGTVDGVRPSYFCQADGNWYFRTGLCKCLPGYQPFNESTQCLACPVGSYKSSTGSDACQPCPPRSSSVELGSVECRCDEGHYRSSSRGPDADCTRPPGSVEDLVITKTDATMVSLSWQPPQDKGGEAVVRYHVDCVSCESERDAPIYRPSQSRLNETRVTVSGLISGRQYTFSVHAENSVSDVSGVFHHSYVSITTDTSASQRVTNVRITDVGVDYVSITWRDVIVPPPNVGHHDINNLVTYEARCVKASELGRQIGTSSNTSSIVTSRTNATFLGLATNTEYLIAVRWKSLKGWSDFSDDVSVLTGQTLVHYQHENPVAIVAGSIVAIALCIVIGLIMIAVIVRRSRHSYCEKHSSDRDVLHSVVANPQAVDNVIVNNHLGSFITLPRDGSVRSYVDPHTYEDPAEAVREFTKEIDASFITIEAVIGGGEFGDVCRGRLKVPGKPEMVVAIKTLKSGASEKNYLDFLTEASIMGQFDDPNVIYLQGVVTRTNPIMIITEFMQNGALNRFLQNNDGQFTVLQLIGMLRGIASGMRYLSEIGFVHRDLAARNILVNESLVCKVADFGLSREMELHSSSGSYTSEGGRIPIRWTAPEAIAYRKFSSSSDVWSYGVVAWEVMSYGEYPYWNWSNEDVINVINTPFRLPPPMDCPEVIYQLMRSCWAKERADRPKFAHIVQSLDRLIRSPELLRELAKPRMNDALSLCRPHPSTSGLDHNAAASLPLLVKSIRPSSTSVVAATASETVPVADWLAGIKMERYAGQLEQAGYRSTADAARLQRQDLVALGITLAGHQKRILSCAAALRVPSGSGTTSAAAADGGRCAVSNEASFV